MVHLVQERLPWLNYVLMSRSKKKKKCAHDVGVKFFPINGPEIVTQYYGESEQQLHEVFDSAIQAAPAVVRFYFSKYCFIYFDFVFD